MARTTPETARLAAGPGALRGLTLAFGGVALLFGAVLVVIAVIAAQNLLARERAVGEGLMLRAGLGLERALRESGPEGAAEVLQGFVDVAENGVAGAELSAAGIVIAHAGAVNEPFVEMQLALGPMWRGHAGRGEPGRRGMSPFRLRLTPVAGVSKPVALARTIVAVAAVTALVLVALAVFAAEGLARREELAAARAEGETLRSLANAGAGLAHRIRNPLASIKGTAQLLAGSSDAKERERAERIVEASDRIDRTLAELLRFARPPEAHREELMVTCILRDAFAREGEGIEVTGPPDAKALVDREHLVEIVEELVANARAFDRAGVISISVSTEGGGCAVEVSDRGPGLSIDAAGAFEPYVTTRPDGTGLGLSIVRALAAANGGRVTLRPRPDGGTVAALHLPEGGAR